MIEVILSLIIFLGGIGTVIIYYADNIRELIEMRSSPEVRRLKKTYRQKTRELADKKEREKWAKKIEKLEAQIQGPAANISDYKIYRIGTDWDGNPLFVYQLRRKKLKPGQKLYIKDPQHLERELESEIEKIREKIIDRQNEFYDQQLASIREAIKKQGRAQDPPSPSERIDRAIDPAEYFVKNSQRNVSDIHAERLPTANAKRKEMGL